MGKVKADLVVAGAKQLITCRENDDDKFEVISGGWIAVKDELIIAVGSKEEVSGAVEYDEENVIDGRGKIVLPGFVDSHTHLVFGGSRVSEYAAKMTTNSLDEIKKMGIKTGIMATVDMTRDISKRELYDEAKVRVLQMLESGTTTVESKSGYGLTTNSEIKILEINRELSKNLPIDVVSTFLGAHGWPEDIPKDEYVRMLVDEMIPYVGKTGLAEFCDVWCDDGHFTADESREILMAGVKSGMKPKIHTDAYSYVGGSDLAADMKMCSADHLNYTPRDVMRKLAKADTVGVLLPAIDFAVKHPKSFDPRPMIEEGMSIALATNCCPGCYNVSLSFVMALACRLHGMSPQEALVAATLGGAKALDLGHDRGSLETGKIADIQIWNTETFEDSIYKFGVNLVEKVIKRGKVVIDKDLDKSFVNL